MIILSMALVLNAKPARGLANTSSLSLKINCPSSFRDFLAEQTKHKHKKQQLWLLTLHACTCHVTDYSTCMHMSCKWKHVHVANLRSTYQPLVQSEHGGSNNINYRKGTFFAEKKISIAWIFCRTTEWPCHITTKAGGKRRGNREGGGGEEEGRRRGWGGEEERREGEGEEEERRTGGREDKNREEVVEMGGGGGKEGRRRGGEGRRRGGGGEGRERRSWRRRGGEGGEKKRKVWCVARDTTSQVIYIYILQITCW